MGTGINFLILFLVALVISAIGFYKFVYFISLGYGFSIAGIGITMLILFRKNLSAVTIGLCVLFIIYGCRLGGYLLVREIRSSAYRNVMKREINDGSGIKFIAKFFTWTGCALLYNLEAAAVFWRLQNNDAGDITAYIGLGIMAFGIAIESLSDFQKTAAKKKNPDRFVDSGLFRVVRCPNYLGEVLCWTGVFISGFSTLTGVLQWSMAIAGWVCIVYIMFGGARRLEIRQDKNYGSNPEYGEYAKKTPILIPLIPLYSVKKYKWLVG